MPRSEGDEFDVYLDGETREYLNRGKQPPTREDIWNLTTAVTSARDRIQQALAWGIVIGAINTAILGYLMYSLLPALKRFSP
jgi:hypothetical protein